MAQVRKPRRAPAALPPTAGDVLLASLRRQGIAHLFVNPGTDFPPIVEGFARAKETRAEVPRPVLVPHENLAVAMAHGAWLVTGAPQAVMVHVNVGTANTVNMLANASRDRVPLILMAGRSPIMEAGVFGARNRSIHWAQEMFDQAGMVRELVKWDYELRNPAQAQGVVARAVEAATASPTGPVYLTLPREPLSAAVEGEPRVAEPRVVPSMPHPDPAAIARLADWIVEAKRPLVIAANLGRAPEEAVALGRVAERFKLPVVAQTPRCLCLATDHPMHAGFDSAPYLAEADLILVIECDVPWMPDVKAPGPRARIVHIGEDPAFLRYPMRGFRSDLSIAAHAGAALEALEAELAKRNARRGLAGPWTGRPVVAGPDAPHITPEYLSGCVGNMAGSDGIIVNEYQLRLGHCARPRPGTYFAISPAGGLGWSVGAALGAKLAAPDRFVVATIGDGGFIFSNPTACHWTAEAHGLPIVMVIFNNARYAAVRNATLSMFASGAAGRENGLGLADLSPSPPFEKIAEAHGAFAARVERPVDLPSVLAAARDAVLKDKRHALVNVITPY
jgi:acetolactate synthase I/II/III large subunit